MVADITSRTWSGKLHVDAPNAEELQADVPEAWRVAGHVSADAELGGTFDNFQLDTTITGSALDVGRAADRSRDRQGDGHRRRDRRVVARAAPGRRAIWRAASVTRGRPAPMTPSLKGDRLSWQGTLLSPNDTQAMFAIQFDGAGTVAQPKGQATLDFALTGGTAGAFIGAGEATADLLGDQARIAARLPSIGALINADIATASPYDYRVNAQLDRFELARLSPFLGAIEAEILGFANGTITASGRLADDRDRVAFVNITELDAGIGGVPVSLMSPLNAELRGDDVTLKDLFVRVGSGRLSASGEWNTRLDGNFRAQYAGDFQDAIRLGKAFGVPATSTAAARMQFDLQSTAAASAPAARWRSRTAPSVGSARPRAVQDLNVNAALNGEQLTI